MDSVCNARKFLEVFEERFQQKFPEGIEWIDRARFWRLVMCGMQKVRACENKETVLIVVFALGEYGAMMLPTRAMQRHMGKQEFVGRGCGLDIDDNEFIGCIADAVEALPAVMWPPVRAYMAHASLFRLRKTSKTIDG